MATPGHRIVPSNAGLMNAMRPQEASTKKKKRPSGIAQHQSQNSRLFDQPPPPMNPPPSARSRPSTSVVAGSQQGVGKHGNEPSMTSVKPKKYRLSAKGMQKRLEHMTVKKYETYMRKLEDREQRRSHRAIRKEQGEEEVSEDSDDEEIDAYAGLTDKERWNRMMNESRAILREEETIRLLTKDKKGQNVLQNMAIKQSNAANHQMERRKKEIHDSVDQIDVLKKELVILEPLSCVHVTLEMCLIGYKEVMRFLSRDDVAQQYEKASLLQLKMSVELIFKQRKSPIQVKVEMLWRFAVVMQDFMQGSRDREKYLLTALYAYNLLKDQVARETRRRAKVALRGTDEEKARLCQPAAWDEGHPTLYWELGAIVNSLEQDREDEIACLLHRRMDQANSLLAFAHLKEKPRKVPMPADVLAPE